MSQSVHFHQGQEFQNRPSTPEYQLTKDNHFQFGYDGHPFIPRTSAEQQWWVTYGTCSREALSFREECLIAAREIRSSTQRDIWICMSGGIDSELVAESFRLAGIKVYGAILEFNDKVNEHDVYWAKRYCDKKGMPYKTFAFDLIKFWENGGMEEIASETGCVTPQFPSTMKLMNTISMMNGFPILGSAECYLEKVNGTWVMYEREKVASLYRFLIGRQIPGVAGFFQWSPELMQSFLQDKKVTQLMTGEFKDKSTYYVKPDIYAQHFEFERRKKYTGFEKIMHLDAIYRSQLLEKFPHSDQVALIPAQELITHLSPPQKKKINKAATAS